MIVIKINWHGGWAQVITDSGTRSCDLKEEDDGYYFKYKNAWHSVNRYATDEVKADVLSHMRGLRPRREISQRQFERICEDVLRGYPDIIEHWFEEPGVLHVVYPSHSGKSPNGAELYFGEKGYITYEGWSCRAGSNEGRFIGRE